MSYRVDVTIEIPEEDLGSLHLTSAEARIELGVALYSQGRLTLGAAAKIAGVQYVQFMRELARRAVPMNYTVQDAQDDLRVVDELLSKRR